MGLNHRSAMPRRRFLKASASLAPFAAQGTVGGQARGEAPGSLDQSRASAQGGSPRRVPISHDDLLARALCEVQAAVFGEAYNGGGGCGIRMSARVVLWTQMIESVYLGSSSVNYGLWLTSLAA